MRHHLTRLAVGFITFSVGVGAATLRVSSPRPVAFEIPVPIVEKQQAELQTPKTYTELCARLWARGDVSDEEKAVAAAQIFISRMGYTSYSDHSEGSAVIMAPCVEGVDDQEASYSSRYDTLEPHAYGLSYLGKGEGGGWSVVFRYTNRGGVSRIRTGRAVTMDEHFKGLRLMHCDFFLNRVDKKL